MVELWASRRRRRSNAQLPVQGVGLMRIEFLFTSYIQEHPCSDRAGAGESELVEKLAQGIAQVAKAFSRGPSSLRPLTSRPTSTTT